MYSSIKRLVEIMNVNKWDIVSINGRQIYAHAKFGELIEVDFLYYITQ